MFHLLCCLSKLWAIFDEFILHWLGRILKEMKLYEHAAVSAQVGRNSDCTVCCVVLCLASTVVYDHLAASTNVHLHTSVRHWSVE